jgi:hypothetical protein
MEIKKSNRNAENSADTKSWTTDLSKHGEKHAAQNCALLNFEESNKLLAVENSEIQFTGTLNQYYQFVMLHIDSIADFCGFGKIHSLQQKATVMKDYEREVIVFSFMADVETYFLCEMCNDGMPFSAIRESFIGMDAIQYLMKHDGRLVIVSPSINDWTVAAVRSKSVPINLLQLNYDGCKFWGGDDTIAQTAQFWLKKGVANEEV